MAKKKLLEAAADVLNASRSQAHADSFGAGTTLHNAPMPIVDLGPAHIKFTDKHPDYTRGVPHATPPGATPPVGAESMKTLDKQPQETMGRKDLTDDPEKENAYDSHDDGISNRVGNVKPTVTPGKGNVKQEGKEVSSSKTISEKKVEKEEKDDDDKKEMKKKISVKEAVEKIILERKSNINEDINVIFSDENLSEDFRNKVITVFEAAVVSRVNEIAQVLEGELETLFNESIESTKSELEESINLYLDYMVQEWIKENEIQIKNNLKVEIVENFISGLRTLFAENYIEVPNEKVDLVSELTTQVSELETKLNEQIQKNMEITRQLGNSIRNEILSSMCEGLTVTQTDKLRSLAEGITFTNKEEFSGKIKTLKESYFPSGVKVPSKDSLNDNQLIQEEDDTTTKNIDPSVALVTSWISKTKNL